MWWMVAAALAAPASLEEADKSGRNVVEVVPSPAHAKVVLRGATVFTATGEVHAPGHVVLDGGKLTAVGAGAPPESVLADATVLDLKGQFVTPGIIDTHSHLGVYPSPGGRAHSDGNEATKPVTAGVWAEHSVWPQDPGFERAMAGGITALQILPGSANLVGGRGVILQNIPARGSRAMRFPGAPETLKIACGENPKRVYGDRGGPSTRMGNVHGHRQAFLDAKEYLEKWSKYADKVAAADDDDGKKKKKKKGGSSSKPPEPPTRNLRKETLAGVLEGRILTHIHCYRADDMLSMLQIADEVGFEVRSFHHAVEAYKIADILAEKQVSVSTWSDWWGFKLEAYDAVLENAAMVHDAGGIAVIHSDSAIGIQRLNQEASKAYHDGLAMGIELDEDDAIQWITKNAAWALGIDDQTGTLEVGKRADVVVWDAHPLSVYANARLVFVEGALRYDKDQPQGWSDFELGQEGVQ